MSITEAKPSRYKNIMEEIRNKIETTVGEGENEPKITT